MVNLTKEQFRALPAHHRAGTKQKPLVLIKGGNGKLSFVRVKFVAPPHASHWTAK